MCFIDNFFVFCGSGGCGSVITNATFMGMVATHHVYDEGTLLMEKFVMAFWDGLRSLLTTGEEQSYGFVKKKEILPLIVVLIALMILEVFVWR